MGSSPVILSVLIPSIEERRDNFLSRIVGELGRQALPYGEKVEVLTLVDNREISVGEKRNRLLEMANGEHLVFIDDDDRIAPNYLDEIMGAIDTIKPLDCIVYDCICTITSWNGRVSARLHCKYGVEYGYTNDGRGNWTGKPAHTMVWRSEIAKRHRYPNTSAGEDIDWVRRACVDIMHQHRIDKVLYYYDNDMRLSSSSQGTRWRLDNPAAARALLDGVGP